MMRVVVRVEMSFVVNDLAMMLKCVLETEQRGRELQPQLQRLAPPLLLLFPRGDGAVISDSEDDSSVKSGSSESEGGVGNNNAYDNNDDGSLPPQVNVTEAPPAAPNIDAGLCWLGRQRKPRKRLIESCNIRAVEALSSNFEFHASCPNFVWRPGSDGKFERFNLWTFQQSLTRLDKLD